MEEIIELGFFKGYTSGQPVYVEDWEDFLIYYEISNLRDELIRYSGPSNWIADLLN